MYCDQRVCMLVFTSLCLSVCLFVCPLAYLKNQASKFHQSNRENGRVNK